MYSKTLNADFSKLQIGRFACMWYREFTYSPVCGADDDIYMLTGVVLRVPEYLSLVDRCGSVCT